jgi:hypothetical protein
VGPGALGGHPLYEENATPLHFAVALTISSQEGYQLYGDLAEVLDQKVGRPVPLILRRSW